jgi:glycosyl transferase family 25
MKQTPIIIISLERAKKRKETMIEQMLNHSLKCEYFPAFDGNDIINAAFTLPIIKGAGIGRKLQTSEICCTLSHLSALKHAQMMEYDEVIILEDDVILCEDWNERITQLLKLLPDDWEYVYLSGHSDYEKFKKYDEPTVIPAPKMVSSFSYMVNKSGIEKLIKQCSELTTTYDDMIMHKILAKKLNGYVFMPFVTYHCAEESYIWGETAKVHSSKFYFKNKIDE